MVSRETPPLRWMTDRGLCIATGEATLELCRRLAAAGLPGVLEWVPGDGMLLAVLAPGAPVPAGLDALLIWHPSETGEAPAREHVIPVRFDGEDLPEVAQRAGRQTDALVELMCSLTLKVKFLGFQPGFAYLEGLPLELCLPRLGTPRKRVPAGSVAVGGGYCGIYPDAGPGGWHLIGTTACRMFDPCATPPARLQAGDVVRLVAA